MGTHIPATFLIPEWLVEFGFIDRPEPVDEFSAPLSREDAHALLSQLHTLIENYVLLGYCVEGVVLARIEANGIQHICYFDLLQNTYLIADDLQSSEVGSWEYHTTEAVPFSGAGAVVGLYVSPFPSPNPGDGTFAIGMELDINSVSESYSVEEPGWLVLIGSGNDPLHFGGVLDAVATNAYDVEVGLKTFVQANLETFVTRADHTDTTGVGMMFILHDGNWVQETSAASFTTANILPMLVQNPDLRSTETTFEEILQKVYDTSSQQVRVSYYAQLGSIMNDVTDSAQNAWIASGGRNRSAFLTSVGNITKMPIFKLLIFLHETHTLDLLGATANTTLVSDPDRNAEITHIDATGFAQMTNGNRRSTMQVNQAGQHIQGYWQTRDPDESHRDFYEFEHYYFVGKLESNTPQRVTFKVVFEELSDDYYKSSDPNDAPTLNSRLIDWANVTDTLAIESFINGNTVDYRYVVNSEGATYEMERLSELPHASPQAIYHAPYQLQIDQRIPLHNDDIPYIDAAVNFLVSMGDAYMAASGPARLNVMIAANDSDTGIAAYMSRFGDYGNPNNPKAGPQLAYVQRMIKAALIIRNEWGSVLALAAYSGYPSALAFYLGLSAAQLTTASLGGSNDYEWRVGPLRDGTNSLVVEAIDYIYTTIKAMAELIDTVVPFLGWDLTTCQIQIRKLTAPNATTYQWAERYVAGWVGGSVGLSAGVSVTQYSSWTGFSTLNDWEPQHFNGILDAWSIKIAIGAQQLPMIGPLKWLSPPSGWSWAGDGTITTFYGDNTYDENAQSGDWGTSDFVGAFIGGEAGYTLGGLHLIGAPPPAIISPQMPTTVFPSQLIQAGDATTFAVDGYTLSEDGKQLIREFAATYQLALMNPRSQLAISGHASSTASASYNMRLSQKRASYAREFLVAVLRDRLTLPQQNLEVRGFGESEALGMTGDNVESEYHRRVDFDLNGETRMVIGSSQ